MGSFQGRFCPLETRYEISKKKNVVSRVKKSSLATSFQGRFCPLETRYEISQKKKMLVPESKNLPWQPVSREDFVLWKPDMRLAKKKKCWFQSQKIFPGNQFPGKILS